jgi:hypothetical protein
MLEAMQRAAEEGEFRIPCGSGKISPSALRLQFYGLCRALRLENKPELPEALGFYLDAPGNALVIRLKDIGEISDVVSAALAGGNPSEASPSPIADSAAAMLSRILGEGGK